MQMRVLPIPNEFDNVFDEDANYAYALEIYRIKPEFMVDPIGVAAAYSVAVRHSCGWRRVALLDAVTGTTAVFVQLFRVAMPFDAQAANAALNANPAVARFFRRIAYFQRTFLSPLPYDPARRNPDPDAAMRAAIRELDVSFSTPQSVVLIDRFGVAPNALPSLILAKQTFFIPRVTRDFQWQLVAAGVEMTAESNQLVQIWTLPEANRLMTTMRAMTQSLQYRQRVLPLLTGEQQELFEPRAR
jgi:hypothetical protein